MKLGQHILENAAFHSDKNIDTHRLRSLAEAHIFAAVAKADGVLSIKEFTQAAYLAQKAQKMLNFLGSNDRVTGFIRDDLHAVFVSPEFSSWTKDQHVKAALEMLKNAQGRGDWAVKLIADKIERSLVELAQIDGYDLNESQFLKDTLKLIRGHLSDGNSQR